jgi:hypothetical protein
MKQESITAAVRNEENTTAYENKLRVIAAFKTWLDQYEADDEGYDEKVDEERPEKEDLPLLKEVLQQLETRTGVLVIVEGGLVQGAWSTDPDLSFDVKDFDNEPVEEGEDHDEIIDELAKGMTAIY